MAVFDKIYLFYNQSLFAEATLILINSCWHLPRWPSWI